MGKNKPVLFLHQNGYNRKEGKFFIINTKKNEENSKL